MNSLDNKSIARVIAFYLPQFHPTKENDDWWGPGFTEWTNVASAKPLFRGHKQPVIPGDLGFYDLRLPETRAAQAELALQYGIEGFCYWHYWFAGRRLLDRPFNEVLESGSPDFPFCLGWANHSWSGVWKNEPNRSLIEQTYPGREDDFEHFKYLLKCFKDPRYIRVDNKPVLVIDNPNHMPDAKTRFDFWRDLAAKEGLDGLYILGISRLDVKNAANIGLDGLIVSTMAVKNVGSPFLNEASRIGWGVLRRLRIWGPRILEYSKAVKYMVPDLDKFNCDAYPCIFPNWDNTPRRGRRGFVLKNSTPALFEKLLTKALDAVKSKPRERSLIFIKSWNEWAEGNYLEPDIKNGKSYLEVVRKLVFRSAH